MARGALRRLTKRGETPRRYRLTLSERPGTLRPPMVSAPHSRTSAPHRWHEVYAEGETPRPLYDPLLTHLLELPPPARRALREQMAATLREMGMSLSHAQGPGAEGRAWSCDLLPQIFDGRSGIASSPASASGCARGRFSSRMCTMAAHILRAGVVPVQAVLASPNYHGVAQFAPPPARRLSASLRAMPRARRRRHAGGEAALFRPRRRHLLHGAKPARPRPRRAGAFQRHAVHSVAEAPVLIMEHFRGSSRRAPG